MENAQETAYALKKLKDQLKAVAKDETLKTDLMLRNLVADLIAVKKKETEKNAAELNSLAMDLLNIEKKEFSLMKIFGIENYELAHSSFLAWLLDPQGSHGLGSQLVEEFIWKAASRTKNLDLTGLDFSNLSVDREVSGDESRLDLRIRDPHGSFLCVVENKILSREGIDQTNRLYRDHHGASPRELFVFLTLDEKAKPNNSNFVSLTYTEILQILESLPIDAANPDASFLIKNYLNTLERLIMSENFEVFSERTKLYYQYEKYIDEVRKAFDKDRQLLLSALESAIRDRPWWGSRWKMQRTGGNITVRKDSWYASKQEGVYIELYMHKSTPVFSLYIYGNPLEFSVKLGPTFKRLLEESYPERWAEGYSKAFAKGVSRFITKDIPLTFSEKDQVQRIVQNLDEMVKMFEATIEKSVEQTKMKA